jgi:isopenicillin N synthase-like dioxygenase
VARRTGPAWLQDECRVDHEEGSDVSVSAAGRTLDSFWNANLLRLSVRVMECLADGLGLPTDTFTTGTVDPGVGDSQSVLRLLHYHPVEGKSFGPNFWRAGAHADFDVLTMVRTAWCPCPNIVLMWQLFQKDGEGGLEVCPGRKVVGDFGMGQDWLPVEARQDRIVCNIGDQLMRVSFETPSICLTG